MAKNLMETHMAWPKKNFRETVSYQWWALRCAASQMCNRTARTNHCRISHPVVRHISKVGAILLWFSSKILNNSKYEMEMDAKSLCLALVEKKWIDCLWNEEKHQRQIWRSKDSDKPFTAEACNISLCRMFCAKHRKAWWNKMWIVQGTNLLQWNVAFL